MSESSRRLWVPVAGLLGLSLLAPQVADAADRVRQAGNIGVGLGASSYGTGVVGKFFVNDANSFQGLVGFREDATVMVFQFDYLYNFEPLWGDDRTTIGWYAGFGGALAPGASDFSLGGSGIIGLDFDIDIAPLDIYAELRPTFVLAPVADFHPVSAGAGARFYF